jgi:hypothetical protein
MSSIPLLIQGYVEFGDSNQEKKER